MLKMTPQLAITELGKTVHIGEFWGSLVEKYDVDSEKCSIFVHLRASFPFTFRRLQLRNTILV